MAQHRETKLFSLSGLLLLINVPCLPFPSILQPLFSLISIVSDPIFSCNCSFGALLLFRSLSVVSQMARVGQPCDLQQRRELCWTPVFHWVFGKCVGLWRRQRVALQYACKENKLLFSTTKTVIYFLGRGLLLVLLVFTA